MRQAEAVIFDLDGCLVDTECLSIQAIVDEMLRLGIETVSFEEIRDKFLGISMQKITKNYKKSECLKNNSQRSL